MIDFKQFQQKINELEKELEKFTNGDGKFVTVGIHEDVTDPDGDITMAGLGATHHFGADINHPGGTDYGYATEKDAREKKVRFLKKGTGYKVLGTTKPHNIKIPARPWLDVGVLSGMNEYKQALTDLQPGNIEQALEIIGLEASAATRVYMRDLKSPPNSPRTIKRKKSSNPLIDTGEMVQSVDYVVTSEKPEEGL